MVVPTDWERLPPSYTLPDGHEGVLSRWTCKPALSKVSTLVTVYDDPSVPDDEVVFFYSEASRRSGVYRAPSWTLLRFLLDHGFARLPRAGSA